MTHFHVAKKLVISVEDRSCYTIDDVIIITIGCYRKKKTCHNVGQRGFYSNNLQLAHNISVRCKHPTFIQISVSMN